MKKGDWVLIGLVGLIGLAWLMKHKRVGAKPSAKQRIKFVRKLGKEVVPTNRLTPNEVAIIQGQQYKVPKWLTTATVVPSVVYVGKTPSVPVIVPVRKGWANVAIVPIANVKRYLAWVSSVTVQHPSYTQLAKQGARVTPSEAILQSLYGRKNQQLPPSITPANVVTQRGIATQAKPVYIVGV